MEKCTTGEHYNMSLDSLHVWHCMEGAYLMMVNLAVISYNYIMRLDMTILPKCFQALLKV